MGAQLDTFTDTRTGRISENAGDASSARTYYVVAGATPILVHNCGGSFTAGNRQWVNSYDGSPKDQRISATEEDGLIEAVVRSPKDVPGLPSGTQMLESAISTFDGVGRKITGHSRILELY
ncbi:hypothetical protein [Streptomyces sp. NPDC090445]|uniref:hypothetical protein n=1 Tax=Streptomyces sp. NPDC090445 TaxID=3365963 RepID=UPI003804F15A